MNKLFFFTLIGILSFACQSNSQYDGKTHFGYDFKYHKKGSGPTADTGLIAYFLIDLKLDDTTSLVPRDPSNIELAPILTPEDNTRKNPVLDALAMMQVGDSLTLYVPVDSMPEMAANAEGYDYILNHISLKDLKTRDQYMEDQKKKQEERMAQMERNNAREPEVAEIVAQGLAAYKEGALENLKELASGVKIHILEEGQGSPVKNKDFIEAHYYGVVQEDGTMFDNSFKRGLPFVFQVGTGSVIQGWDQGFPQLSRGDRAILFIPYDMAYGDAGSGPIPPKADLAFYVEVIDK